ncbi:thioesterase-like superfamily-domain-containing protein [Cantharellus anzutake]|uniref:thioesterase-like superfamily-domain-containing protein n=1 Tax=Cantharellus anzutake TaxID=1750568 RepID=UPI00190464C1|nr:thioesterase-like superfamily-domain-containing protein [Cantharellus anzutake]XP_038919035.1 thioesterase-like superfamily-domain-containing protein [Cantharellus anzutake]KAF8317549.1 thioesterase-like superfamily-domain-containing protein [Cantharellus anzutake]KAF8335982.1 thioesterase-like superfamily-domain-containing protein [Cantharellus anzutake]
MTEEMGRYSDAVKSKLVKKLDDGTHIYEGTLCHPWTVEAVSHGGEYCISTLPAVTFIERIPSKQQGYLMGCIIQAVISFQSNSSPKQLDPIHISSHYLNPSHPGQFEVHVRPHRLGRRYSNITADLFQQGNMCITSRVIVGTLPDPSKIPEDRSMPSLALPHPFATRIPFRSHPAAGNIDQLPSKLVFRDCLKSSFDHAVAERTLEKMKNPADSDGGLDHAQWYQLLGEKDGERVGLPAIPFFADLCRNTPGILPKDIAAPDSLIRSWFPTLVLNLEFKLSLSSLPGYISPTTFGVFSVGRFIWQGRHEVRSEVWTSPSEIGTGGRVDPDWREKQFCVAIATQMALSIPIEVNKRKAKSNL